MWNNLFIKVGVIKKNAIEGIVECFLDEFMHTIIEPSKDFTKREAVKEKELSLRYRIGYLWIMF